MMKPKLNPLNVRNLKTSNLIDLLRGNQTEAALVAALQAEALARILERLDAQKSTAHKSPDEVKQRIGVEEVAAILGVNTDTIRRYACKGKLPGARKIGRDWTFDPDRINAMFAKAR